VAGGHDQGGADRELDQAIQFPGLTNAWTMPIKTRIDMLSTGIKTPVGIKIGGPDLLELERIAKQVEAVVKPLKGTCRPMPSG
jgi:Cu(I)/Ag(I) efflux system membrane protein CusA/SilA